MADNQRLIRMTESRQASPDGLTVLLYEIGGIYMLPKTLAASLVRAKSAEFVEVSQLETRSSDNRPAPGASSESERRPDKDGISDSGGSQTKDTLPATTEASAQVVATTSDTDSFIPADSPQPKGSTTSADGGQVAEAAEGPLAAGKPAGRRFAAKGRSAEDKATVTSENKKRKPS